jgi:hypothetical protein
VGGKVKFLVVLPHGEMIGVPIEQGTGGGLVVETLSYKPAGRGFDSRWFHWNFSVTLSFRSHYGPGVDSASNRNEYQVYFLGVKAPGA